MDPLEIKKRIFAADKLLTGKTTSKQKIESVNILLRGINPGINKLLEDLSRALSDLEKFQKGELIELSIEHLPEDTEERKKRKKALIFLINNLKSLNGEVERIKKEFEKANQTVEQKIQSGGKIVAFAKGPFGVITVLAVIAVIGFSLIGGKKIKTVTGPANRLQTETEPTPARTKIKVIVVDGKQIPLTELTIGQGLECLDGSSESPHYHAKNLSSAEALDGTSVTDPGGCGLGKVSEIDVIETE